MQGFSQRGVRVSFGHPSADFGHLNIHIFVYNAIGWKGIGHPIHLNMYFWTPNSKILAKVLLSWLSWWHNGPSVCLFFYKSFMVWISLQMLCSWARSPRTFPTVPRPLERTEMLLVTWLLNHMQIFLGWQVTESKSKSIAGLGLYIKVGECC